MKLSVQQAEVLEEYLGSDGWMTMLDLLGERIEAKQNALKSGRLDPTEYIQTCAAIRELEYLRDEPPRLVRNTYVRSLNGSRPFGGTRSRGSGN